MVAREPTAQAQIAVRDMTVNDVPEVVALDATVTGLQPDVSRSGVIDSYVTAELGLSCVAEVDGHIVGYVLGRLAYTPAPVAESAWIQLVGVDPAYRERGVGKRLLQRFCKRCKDRGVRVVHASVPTTNAHVQVFLAGCGFQPAEWTVYTASV